jgi:hypothetical protein
VENWALNFQKNPPRPTLVSQQTILNKKWMGKLVNISINAYLSEFSSLIEKFMNFKNEQKLVAETELSFINRCQPPS